MKTKTKGFFKKLLSSVLSAACVLSGTAVIGTTALTTSEVTAQAATGDPSAFAWDNATVYFLLTDRFKNGDTSNDNAYGRQNIPMTDKRATMHGGDFKGITDKIKEGYFDDLGVNAIWLSAPYEQIHGYIVGGDNYFHYSYHGYYVLDYTESDKAFGSKEEFRTLVDTAHEHGIRIVMDIVMNHAGYNSMYDMNEYGFGVLKSGWDTYYNQQHSSTSEYHDYIDYKSGESQWGQWWTNDWVRAGLPGYSKEGDGSALQESLEGLPDFRTEQTKQVSLPPFLVKKWTNEGTLSQKQSKFGTSNTVTGFLSTWLADWVKEFGVDGFRCDTAKHVDLASWKALKTACVAALKEWKSKNPSKKLDDLDFWMTGEHWEHGVSKDDYYTNGGFDSMINFDMCGAGNLDKGKVAGKYNDYANAINKDDSFNVLSFISSHDETLARTSDMYFTGSAFLMLPGAVQIFYGDESNRQLVPGVPFDGYGKAGHALRSDMNWDNGFDKELCKHWGIVGRFRKAHRAVGAGDNKTLTASDGIAFARTYNKNGIDDKIIGVIGAAANAQVSVDVGGLWPDGTALNNFYDDSMATVTGGKVTFSAGAHGTILIQEPDGSKGYVKVKHVDESTGDVIESQTLAGIIGESYTTSPITMEGYTVSRTEGPKTGVFAESEVTVTYYYKFDSANYGYVVTKHVDAASGTEIADSVKKVGKIGTTYTTEPVEVKNYEVDLSKTTNATGTFKSGTITVTYKYTYVEPTNLRVHYYNANNWTDVYLYAYDESGATVKEFTGAWPGKKMTPESDGWVFAEVDDTEAATIIFNNNAGAQEPAGVGTPGYSASGEVWYKNGSPMKTGTVNVVYSSTDGTVLGTQKITGLADGTTKYTTTAKTFTGYKLKTTPTNATGLFTETPITVTYVYEPDSPSLTNKSIISSESISRGGSVTVKASATGGSGGYTYEVKYKKASDSSYATKQSYSSNTKVTITLNTETTYEIVVTAKDSSGNTAPKTFSVRVSGDNTLKNTSKLASSTINLGQNATVNCSATGGSGTKKYAVFYKKTSDTKWATAQDYSTNATVKFKPGKAATYDVCAKVKDSTGEVKNYLTLKVVDNELKNTSKLASSTVELGQNVTVNCSSTGGTGTKKYAVYYKKTSDTKWATAQDYSTNTTVKFKPGKTVKYDVCVKVKDGSKKEVKKYFVATVAQPLKNTSKISVTSVALGKSITVTCSATGGGGYYNYAVYYKRTSTSQWSEVQKYSSNDTVKITPKSATTFDIYIKVKDNKGTVAKKYYTLKTVNPLTNKSSLASTNVVVGSTAKVNLSATGGNGGYKYAVYYKKTADTQWATVIEYKEKSSVTFTPGKVSKYDVCVKVKDSSGTLEKKYYTLNSYAALKNTSKVSATTIEKGKTVTVTLASSGGTGTKKYAVYYKKSADTEWATTQEFSTNTTVKITLGKAVNYDICAKVKDGAGNLEKKYFVIKVTNGAVTNTSTVSATSIVKGKTVTVKCSATGGSGSYKYAIYYKKTTESTWAEAQAFSSTISKAITLGKPVAYDICVKAKDSSGTEDKRYLTVVANNASTSFKNTSAISATSVAKNTKVTITGKSSYGKDAVIYRYEYKAPSGDYVTIKDYTSSTTAAFTPTKAGKYTVRVIAQDMTPSLAVKTFEVTVK